MSLVYNFYESRVEFEKKYENTRTKKILKTRFLKKLGGFQKIKLEKGEPWNIVNTEQNIAFRRKLILFCFDTFQWFSCKENGKL